METGLAGRTVVVTGANANIGRAIALGFAHEGCNVVVVGRDAARGAWVCAQLLDGGAADALWVAADVTDRPQVEAMVEAALARFGRIDVLVNNVGGNVGMDRFVDSDPETWERDIALNIGSTLNCTHAVLPGMLERRSGRIINMGSSSGIVGDPLLAVYSAMKGAVHAFTRVLAKEVGPDGVTVNAIAPYGTLPEGPDDVSPGSRWHPDGLIALGRPPPAGRSSTRSVGARCSSARPPIRARSRRRRSTSRSDAAGFVTGQVLSVDGGTQLA